MASPGLRTVLIPGLLGSVRLHDPVWPTAWAYPAVTVADNRRDDTIGGKAARLLDDAPGRFVLVGLSSMGGCVAHELSARHQNGCFLSADRGRPELSRGRPVDVEVG